MIRYILSTDGFTEAEQNAVTQYLQDRKYEFWHHFKETWLIADHTHTIGMQALTKDLAEISPLKYLLLNVITGDFGYGLYAAPSMGQWLRKHWTNHKGAVLPENGIGWGKNGAAP